MSVTISYKKFKFVPVTVTWFNTESKFKFESNSAFHILRQSSALSAEIMYNCIKHYKSKTTILDLTQPEEQLWKNLDPKSCRYEIRKILKMIDAGQKVQIKRQTDLNEFLTLANNYIRAKGYTQPLTLGHFQRYLKDDCGELQTIFYQDQLLGGNFFIKDHPSRVRLLYSFNNRFEDKRIEKLSGPCMRYLHWHAIKNFKDQGFQSYDFGGVDTDPDAATYGISKFKLSFGGEVFEENNYVFVRNKFISNTYKMYQKLTKK